MRKLRLLIILLLTIKLSACSSVPTLSDIAKLSPWYTYNEVEEISLYVAPDPELRYALNIDVIFVYQDLLLTVLGDFSALDWFAQKPAILSSYSSDIDVLQWQVVPGFAEQSKTLPQRHSDAIAVMAFVYYPPNPDTKAVLTELKTPWLIFKQGKLSTLEHPPLGITKGDKS